MTFRFNKCPMSCGMLVSLLPRALNIVKLMQLHISFGKVRKKFSSAVRNRNFRNRPMDGGSRNRSLWLTINSSKHSSCDIESGSSCSWFSSIFSAIRLFMSPIACGSCSSSFEEMLSSCSLDQLQHSFGSWVSKLLLASKWTNLRRLSTLDDIRLMRLLSIQSSVKLVSWPMTSGWKEI